MEIKVMKNIMDVNNKIADENRAFFREKGITAVNVMASPGAGKTSIIMELVKLMGRDIKFGVIEGDIASSIDAEKIDAMGVPVVQINTGGGCHLDANMIRTVVTENRAFEGSILFIENVGNLVCPSSFDLGESVKMVVASVPEGHDKPFKYTSMFEAADVIVLNKVDLMNYVDFDRKLFYKGVGAVNGKAEVIEVSCKTGVGFAKLAAYLRGLAARE